MTAAGYAARFNSVAYDASTERLLDNVLLHPSTATRARAGRRPGTGLEATVGGTPEAVTIAAGGGIVDDSGRGSYRFVIPIPYAITLPARPSSGTSRIDYVAAQVRDVDANPADGAGVREVEIVHVPGTAGASPSAPTLATGQLALAKLTVPASGTIAIANVAPRIAAAGGIIIVATSTERDAISPLFNGIVVYREDNNTVEARVNGAWRVVYASGDVFTGNEGAFIGSAPPAGTRKIIKQATVVTTASAGGGFDILYHDGAFPNGVVSVLASPGDTTISGLTVVPIFANCSLGHYNGIAYNGAGAAVATGSGVRINYLAVGW